MEFNIGKMRNSGKRFEQWVGNYVGDDVDGGLGNIKMSTLL